MRGVKATAIAACAAGQVSEDSYGQVGDEDHGAVWVLDGATGLGDKNYIAGAYSDAAWYAQELSKGLVEFSLTATTPEEVFTLAIQQAAAAWQAQVSENNLPRYVLPSAAGIWLRWHGGMLEAVSLGDCRAWHVGSGGELTQLGLLDENPNDEWLATQITQHQATGIAAQGMRAAVIDVLRTARSRMNQPNGYWIFSIHPETAQHLHVKRLPLVPGHLVLCSDGLFRWVDIYRQGSAANFVQASIQNIQDVLARVRELENGDLDCKTYPRLKNHDDATGLVLSVS